MPRRPDMPPLRREELASDPVTQFEAWWELALKEAVLAEAMTLATMDDEGAPDARMVLLKGFDQRGFRFHTNYGSAKGRQLDAAGSAALVLYWRELDRQVRVRGAVERLSAEESDEYWRTRPRESQLGAWASPQSEVLASREALDEGQRALRERFEGEDVPRPEHWGGYVLRPDAVEFWQGQVGRLHDRFRYSRDGDSWKIDRLAP
jgi:pyridoxamine 5'-phosphate oxidase